MVTDLGMVLEDMVIIRTVGQLNIPYNEYDLYIFNTNICYRGEHCSPLDVFLKPYTSFFAGSVIQYSFTLVCIYKSSFFSISFLRVFINVMSKGAVSGLR